MEQYLRRNRLSELLDGMGVTIIAHGEDEAQAVCEMARLLEEG